MNQVAYRDRRAPAQQQGGGREVGTVEEVSREIVGMRAEFEKMLGGAVAVERFERTLLTAIQRDPGLLALPRETLVNACLKAAQDRLLPDGREGVLLARYNSRTKRQEAAWQPMIYGVIKLAKQYAGVKSLSCEIVYEGEPFRVLLGDEMRIEHERVLSKVKSGAEVGCYAIAVYEGGAREREIMTREEIAAVEAASDSAKRGFGPWKGPFRGEMVRKSVIRRLAKRMPAMDEGAEAFHRAAERVDEEYNFGRGDEGAPTIDGEAEPHAEAAPRGAPTDMREHARVVTGQPPLPPDGRPAPPTTLLEAIAYANDRIAEVEVMEPGPKADEEFFARIVHDEHVRKLRLMLQKAEPGSQRAADAAEIERRIRELDERLKAPAAAAATTGGK